MAQERASIDTEFFNHYLALRKNTPENENRNPPLTKKLFYK